MSLRWPALPFLSVLACLAASPEWPQFGGPNRNFQVDQKGLAPSWPAGGPKKLWSRPLGEGYSSIAIDNGTLYTMYRSLNREIVIAADAKSGKTLWEFPYDAPSRGQDLQFGPGPHSTPLVAGDRLFTIGINENMYALDKKTGKVLWSKNLEKDFPGATFMDRGYSGSPLAYREMIIVQIGGPKHSVIALKQSDGSLVWAGGSFDNAPNSPQIFNVSGEDQVVAFMKSQVVGLNAMTGAVLWSHSHQTDYGLNISMPVWGSDNILFLSSAYGGGSRAIQLARAGGKTTAKELWAHKQMRVHHSAMIRIGDFVYGSSGDFGPAPFTAIEVKTGKVAWRDRSLSKAGFVYADGKLIIVDEDGNLLLATVSPEGLKILAKSPLLTHNAWTAPSLAGTTLYARDRKTMVAVDLK